MVIVVRCIICQKWGNPMRSNGTIDGHHVIIRISHNAAVVVIVQGRFREMDQNRLGQLKVLAHSYNISIGLLQTVLHILKPDVVCGGSIVSNGRDSLVAQQNSILKWRQSWCFASFSTGRDSLCCTTHLNFERGIVMMLCFHYFINKVDYHTSGFDLWKTANHVHVHLGPGGDN